MGLGEKLRQARLEAGLSQRQLCAGVVTRNMLSQIENGTARPSMDTLKALAARLGKPVSFFLEEQTVTSPNTACMASARAAAQAGDWDSCRVWLDTFLFPDETFQEEYALLRHRCLLALAQTALEQGKAPYARELLTQAGSLTGLYLTDAARREEVLLLGQMDPLQAAAQLPPDDRPLLLRAEAALLSGDGAKCVAILQAVQDETSPQYHLLLGQGLFTSKNWEKAAQHLTHVEEFAPKTVVPLLEDCYRELGDYRLAYFYACKGREL